MIGQLTVIVAESLIKNAGFNPNHMAESYLKWFDSGEARGYGTTTKLAMDNLRAGKSYSESGIVGSYGNGTAMRVSPFGAFFANDINSLVKSIKIDSAITHVSEEAEAGALAIGLSIAFCINKEHDDLLNKLLPFLPKSNIKESLSSLESMINSDMTPDKVFSILGTKADVRMTVPSVLYAFFKYPTFDIGVPAIIRAGGDTDTNASILGALYAARDGKANMLPYWIDNIENSKYIQKLDKNLISKDISLFLR